MARTCGRVVDLAKLNREHLVNPDSNYCFGGGAGPYSDGKLYTRSKKRGDIREALEWLVLHGADPSILVEAHPHIGTNRLPAVVTAMRETIERAGGEVRFDTKVVDLHIENERCNRVVVLDLKTGDHNELVGDAVILATGHSARDIFFELFDSKGILIEPKPFAMGVRVEHPQSWVDHVQYHGEPVEGRLPPASYNLVCQVEGRGVHSFCMCPGGIVAPCATSPGEIVTNGWSPSKRNNPYANSGMVVQVEPKDWEPLDSQVHLAASLSGERGAGLLGSGRIHPSCSGPAPGRFCAGQASKTLPPTSYLPGVQTARLDEILPPVVSSSLRQGFKAFARKMNNFMHPDAVVIGPETRTSSPVRIPRDPLTLEHPHVQGLYPTGEGGGYAGGFCRQPWTAEKWPWRSSTFKA